MVWELKNKNKQRFREETHDITNKKTMTMMTMMMMTTNDNEDS